MNFENFQDETYDLNLVPKVNFDCVFWISCVDVTDMERAEHGISRLRHGFCCEKGWIGTSLNGTKGIWDPNEFGKRIGPSQLMLCLAVLASASLLVATLSSFTSAFALAYPLGLTSWSSLKVWTTSHPMTSMMLFMVFFMITRSMVVNSKKAMAKSRSHLGPGQTKRKWKGGLRQKLHFKLRKKGMILTLLYVEAMGMDAQQANDLLTRIMELSNAATQAATTATSMIGEFKQQGKGSSSRFGDGVKVLRPPDTFEVDDPVRYSLWREQFLNWLVFCDSRYGELIKDVENLELIESMETSDPDVKELSTKLYSILSPYLRGPALQICEILQ